MKDYKEILKAIGKGAVLGMKINFYILVTLACIEILVNA